MRDDKLATLALHTFSLPRCLYEQLVDRFSRVGPAGATLGRVVVHANGHLELRTVWRLNEHKKHLLVLGDCFAIALPSILLLHQILLEGKQILLG